MVKESCRQQDRNVGSRLGNPSLWRLLTAGPFARGLVIRARSQQTLTLRGSSISPRTTCLLASFRSSQTLHWSCPRPPIENSGQPQTPLPLHTARRHRADRLDVPAACGSRITRRRWRIPPERTGRGCAGFACFQHRLACGEEVATDVSCSLRPVRKKRQVHKTGARQRNCTWLRQRRTPALHFQAGNQASPMARCRSHRARSPSTSSPPGSIPPRPPWPSSLQTDTGRSR
jgi:hypothetical protein